MATAYGLALQGIGEAEIDVNLAPSEMLREQAWNSKTKWFVAAAGVAVAAGAMMFVSPIAAQNSLGAGMVRGENEVKKAVSTAKQNKSQLNSISSEASIGFKASNFERLLEDREIWPHLVTDAMNAVASAGPQPDFSTPTWKDQGHRSRDRRLILLEDLGATYSVNGSDRFGVEMKVAFSTGQNPPVSFVNDTIGRFVGTAGRHVPACLTSWLTGRYLESGDLETVTVGTTASRAQAAAAVRPWWRWW